VKQSNGISTTVLEMPTTFRNKVALITGASSGIGRALAFAFARDGARVVLVARNAEKLREVEKSIGSTACSLPADVTRPAEVERAVAETVGRFGRIDVLVNNAGIGFCGSVEETSLDDFRNVFETNFFAPMQLTQLVGRHMIRQRSGIIIQISSLNGFCAVPLSAAYSASKFALEGMSQSARIELRRHGVHVLIVRPGVTDTEFFDHAPHFRERNPFPMKRMMSAETAAQRILVAAARGRSDIVLTRDGKLLWWFKKFSPRLIDRIILNVMNKSVSQART
jgi:short-subunit dehydrogenase